MNVQESIVCVDSFNRDVQIYPDSEDFALDLGRSYHFTAASLVSLELPMLVSCIERDWSAFEYDCGVPLPLTLEGRTLRVSDERVALPAAAQRVSSLGDGRWSTAEPHGLTPELCRVVRAQVLILGAQVLERLDVLSCSPGLVVTAPSPVEGAAYLMVTSGGLGRLSGGSQLASVVTANLPGEGSERFQHLVSSARKRVSLPIGPHNEESLARSLEAQMNLNGFWGHASGKVRVSRQGVPALIVAELRIDSWAPEALAQKLAQALQGQVAALRVVDGDHLELDFDELVTFESEGDQRFERLGLPASTGPTRRVVCRALPRADMPGSVHVVERLDGGRLARHEGRLILEASPTMSQGASRVLRVFADSTYLCEGHLCLGTWVNASGALGRVVAHRWEGAASTLVSLCSQAGPPGAPGDLVVPLSDTGTSLNLHFPTPGRWSRLAEVLGFQQGGASADPATGRLVSPRQMNFDPPSYLLMELELGQFVSSNVHHSCGPDHRSGALLTKIPTYYGTRVLERGIPATKTTTSGVSTARHVRVRLLTPWHSPWPMHGREYSFTLQLVCGQYTPRTTMP
jgi:hypothetical protein